MRTPENILRHELIGLKVKIAKSSSKSLERIRGIITDETKNMLVIESRGKRKMVPKNESTFHISLEDGKVVEVEGRLLVGRPEDRIKI